MPPWGGGSFAARPKAAPIPQPDRDYAWQVASRQYEQDEQAWREKQRQEEAAMRKQRREAGRKVDLGEAGRVWELVSEKGSAAKGKGRGGRSGGWSNGSNQGGSSSSSRGGDTWATWRGGSSSEASRQWDMDDRRRQRWDVLQTKAAAWDSNAGHDGSWDSVARQRGEDRSGWASDRAAPQLSKDRSGRASERKDVSGEAAADRDAEWAGDGRSGWHRPCQPAGAAEASRPSSATEAWAGTGRSRDLTEEEKARRAEERQREAEQRRRQQASRLEPSFCRPGEQLDDAELDRWLSAAAAELERSAGRPCQIGAVNLAWNRLSDEGVNSLSNFLRQHGLSAPEIAVQGNPLTLPLGLIKLLRDPTTGGALRTLHLSPAGLSGEFLWRLFEAVDRVRPVPPLKLYLHGHDLGLIEEVLRHARLKGLRAAGPATTEQLDAWQAEVDVLVVQDVPAFQTWQ